MSSRLIHVVAYDRITFLFKTEWYSFIFIYHILLIHSSIHEHLDCLYLLTVVSNATINLGIQMSPWFPAFNYIARYGAGSYDNSVYNILRNYRIVFCSSCTILPSHQQCTISPHSHQHLFSVFFFFFDNNHPNGYEVVSYCGLDLHFPND